MEQDAASHPVSVVVSRRVAPDQGAAFEAALRELLDLAASQPGHRAGEVLRGQSASDGRDYHIVYRFADDASLRAWEAVPARRALVERIDKLAGEAGRRRLTGLEAWFDLPPGQAPPPRHRMALLTWVGIWPLVSLALWAVAPRLGSLPFLARTAFITALTVLAMTYVVMPRLARFAAPWLQPKPR